MQETEPRTYAWTVEGEVTSGTLERYARDWENAEYAGVTISGHVWDGRVWDGKSRLKPVTVTSDGTDSNDYMHYTIKVGNETVPATIDGRA